MCTYSRGGEQWSQPISAWVSALLYDWQTPWQAMTDTLLLLPLWQLHSASSTSFLYHCLWQAGWLTPWHSGHFCMLLPITLWQTEEECMRHRRTDEDACILMCREMLHCNAITGRESWSGWCWDCKGHPEVRELFLLMQTGWVKVNRDQTLWPWINTF